MKEKIFDIGDNVNLSELAFMLEKEREQLIAVVLSHLKIEDSAFILNFIAKRDVSKKEEILRRIRNLNYVNSEIIELIEKIIYEYFKKESRILPIDGVEIAKKLEEMMDD